MAVQVYQEDDEKHEDTALSSEEELFADLGNVILSDGSAARTPVKRALLHVPVRRPDRQWFFRVHPSAEYRQDIPYH